MVTMTVAYWDFVPITAAGQRGHLTPLPSAHPFGYQPTNRAPGLCQGSKPRGALRHFLDPGHGPGAQAVEALGDDADPPLFHGGQHVEPLLETVDAAPRHEALPREDEVGRAVDDLLEGVLGVFDLPVGRDVANPEDAEGLVDERAGTCHDDGLGLDDKEGRLRGVGALLPRLLLQGRHVLFDPARQRRGLLLDTQRRAQLPDAPGQLLQASGRENMAGDAEVPEAVVDHLRVAVVGQDHEVGFCADDGLERGVRETAHAGLGLRGRRVVAEIGHRHDPVLEAQVVEDLRDVGRKGNDPCRSRPEGRGCKAKQDHDDGKNSFHGRLILCQAGDFVNPTWDKVQDRLSL